MAQKNSANNFAQQLEQRGYQRALQATHAQAWQAAEQSGKRKAKIEAASGMLAEK